MICGHSIHTHSATRNLRTRTFLSRTCMRTHMRPPTPPHIYPHPHPHNTHTHTHTHTHTQQLVHWAQMNRIYSFKQLWNFMRGEQTTQTRARTLMLTRALTLTLNTPCTHSRLCLSVFCGVVLYSVSLLLFRHTLHTRSHPRVTHNRYALAALVNAHSPTYPTHSSYSISLSLCLFPCSFTHSRSHLCRPGY